MEEEYPVTSAQRDMGERITAGKPREESNG